MQRKANDAALLLHKGDLYSWKRAGHGVGFLVIINIDRRNVYYLVVTSNDRTAVGYETINDFLMENSHLQAEKVASYVP